MDKKQRSSVDAPLNAQARTRVDRVIDKMISSTPSFTDPFGSYTGKPVEYGAAPVQDADDL